MHAARLSSVPGELNRYPLFEGLQPRPTNVTVLALVWGLASWVVPVVVVAVVVVVVVVGVVSAVD